MSDINLPCIDFPIDHRERYPAQQTEPHTEGALIHRSRKSEAKSMRSVVLSFSVMSAAEQALILAAWDGGNGIADSFAFTLPGEATSRRWIFAADTLSLSRASYADRSAQFELIDVTPPQGA